jgi:hypothetical protein
VCILTPIRAFSLPFQVFYFLVLFLSVYFATVRFFFWNFFFGISAMPEIPWT